MESLTNPAGGRADDATEATVLPRDVVRMPAAARRPHAARAHADTDDLQRLLGDLAALVAGLTVATREFGRVSGRLRGAAADLGDAVGDAWDVARRHGGGALRGAERALAARPYVAIGVAAALVVAIGVAARHRYRDVAHDEYDGWDHFV